MKTAKRTVTPKSTKARNGIHKPKAKPVESFAVQKFRDDGGFNPGALSIDTEGRLVIESDGEKQRVDITSACQWLADTSRQHFDRDFDWDPDGRRMFYELLSQSLNKVPASIRGHAGWIKRTDVRGVLKSFPDASDSHLLFAMLNIEGFEWTLAKIAADKFNDGDVVAFVREAVQASTEGAIESLQMDLEKERDAKAGKVTTYVQKYEPKAGKAVAK